VFVLFHEIDKGIQCHFVGMLYDSKFDIRNIYGYNIMIEKIFLALKGSKNGDRWKSFLEKRCGKSSTVDFAFYAGRVIHDCRQT